MANRQTKRSASGAGRTTRKPSTRRPGAEKRSRTAKKRRRIWPWVVLGVLVFLAAGAGAGLYGGYRYFAYDLPKLDKLDDYRPRTISWFYARDGQPIAQFFEERREVVPLHRMPQSLINAFVAAEDSDFFTHPGVDLWAIFRAAVRNFEAGRIVQGGSTITQQVTKSFLLSPEKSYRRKIREALLAYQIDQRFTKNEILYLYLNQIYLGAGAYGVASAADIYFQRSVEHLSLAECAMLAGLPQAPSRYSPRKHFERAKERQIYVLGRMVEEGYVTAEQAQKAMDEDIFISQAPIRMKPRAPYFVEHVRRLVEAQYGEGALLRDGLKVYTTLDLKAQTAAETAVARGLYDLDHREGYRGPLRRVAAAEMEQTRTELDEANSAVTLAEGAVVQGLVIRVEDKQAVVSLGRETAVLGFKDNRWARKPDPGKPYYRDKLRRFRDILTPGDVVRVKLKAALKGGGWSAVLDQDLSGQAALVAMDSATGHIISLVGGRDYDESQFNRATQALRQPGSAFKPFIYAAALDRNFSAASVFLDAPVVYYLPGSDKPWKPKNYSLKFYGPTTMRVALEKSRNVVTVKMLDDIGPKYVVDYAARMGVSSDLTPNLSLALGTSEVTVIDMVQAYSTFCNLGQRTEPVFITRIEDRTGRVVHENSLSQERVIEATTAYITTRMLQGVVTHGTGWRLRALKRPMAGKTGTTNDLRDAWFVGFSPELVTAVWVGHDDMTTMGKGETGSRTASPIWVDFMKVALEGRPKRDFKVPDGVVFARIDKKTGLLAGPQAKKAILECFKPGTVPTRTAPAAGSPSGQGRDFLMVEGEGAN